MAVIGDNFDGPIMPSRHIDNPGADRRRVDQVAQTSFSEHLRVTNQSNDSFTPNPNPTPGGLPFDRYLYRLNKIDRAAEPRVDEMTQGRTADPTPGSSQARSDQGVKLWPRLADVSPVPEVRMIQELRTVYQIEIPPQSGSFLDIIC